MTGPVRIVVDGGNVVSRQFSELERTQLPFATSKAINATAFETQQRWAEVMPRIFDRPTSLTRRAVVYTQSTKRNLSAEVKIRDEAYKGTPPAKYLVAQVMGGSRGQKGIERQLTAAGLLPAGMFVVPGQGAKLDQHGNIPRSQINQIKSQLGAQSDPLSNESPVSRGRRLKRNAKKGVRGGNFFAVKSVGGRLPAGVYERVATGFGSALRSVLHFVRSVSYRRRYPIFDMAQTIFNRRYPANFEKSLSAAVASAWARTFNR